MEIVAILLVNLITSLTKKLSMIRWSVERKFITRFIVAILSFGTVVAMSINSGTDVDSQAIEVFVDSVMVFLGATGAYYLSKK